MIYTFNPHRHVKIWLSKDADSFLNIENQIRLVNMRSINQYDAIYLIYDRRLLSDSACKDLTQFCEKQTILHQDVQQNIIPYCQSTEEKRLIAIYQDEIQHVSEGGNLAVASDLLRWLKPIYTLGTYSDFDTKIDTRCLPPYIEVKQTILLNLGGIAIPIGSQKYEIVALNNDIIAVVNPEIAEATIKKIQCSLYAACTKQLSYKNSAFLAYINWEKKGHAKLGLLFPNPNYPDFRMLAKLGKEKTIRELRVEILRQTENNQIFCSEMGMSVADIAAVTKEALKESLMGSRLAKKQIKEFKKRLAMSDEALITTLRQTYQSDFLLLSVIHTTGPSRLLATLFSSMYNASAMEFTDTVIPSALCHYGLEKAFQSGQYLAFHSTQAAYSQMLEAEIGQKNDCAWLSLGQEAVQKREVRIKRATSTIQRFFRKNKIKNQMHMASLSVNDRPNPLI